MMVLSCWWVPHTVSTYDVRVYPEFLDAFEECSLFDGVKCLSEADSYWFLHFERFFYAVAQDGEIVFQFPSFC